ncbi:hypothetical protein K7432_014898 [Basidiobolus ranarum]|uniref:Uncharacterized protein n=1 Tax=Basidiobolus ranarum TaxID=34480 RepID=A0ABR2VP09_9FUNG
MVTSNIYYILGGIIAFFALIEIYRKRRKILRERALRALITEAIFINPISIRNRPHPTRNTISIPTPAPVSQSNPASNPSVAIAMPPPSYQDALKSPITEEMDKPHLHE